MKAIFFVYIVLPLLAITVAGISLYFRVTGDLSVCRNYYPEMKLAECYFSSKTVRVPEGK